MSEQDDKKMATSTSSDDAQDDKVENKDVDSKLKLADEAQCDAKKTDEAVKILEVQVSNTIVENNIKVDEEKLNKEASQENKTDINSNEVANTKQSITENFQVKSEVVEKVDESLLYKKEEQVASNQFKDEKVTPVKDKKAETSESTQSPKRVGRKPKPKVLEKENDEEEKQIQKTEFAKEFEELDDKQDKATEPTKSKRGRKRSITPKPAEVPIAKTQEVSPSKKPNKLSDVEKTKSESIFDNEEAYLKADDNKHTLGLLEQPLTLIGKRERKLTQRLTIQSTDSPNKASQAGQGHGIKLADIPNVLHMIEKSNLETVRLAHRICFNSVGKKHEIKRNLRRFNGYSFNKESVDYEKKHDSLLKLTVGQLKSVCEIFNIEKSGTKEDLIERVLEFALSPKESGLKLPSKSKPKKKKKRGTKNGKAVDRKSIDKKKATSDAEEVKDDENEEDDDKEGDESGRENESSSEDEKEETEEENENDVSKASKKSKDESMLVDSSVADESISEKKKTRRRKSKIKSSSEEEEEEEEEEKDKSEKEEASPPSKTAKKKITIKVMAKKEAKPVASENKKAATNDRQSNKSQATKAKQTPKSKKVKEITSSESSSSSVSESSPEVFTKNNKIQPAAVTTTPVIKRTNRKLLDSTVSDSTPPTNSPTKAAATPTPTSPIKPNTKQTSAASKNKSADIPPVNNRKPVTRRKLSPSPEPRKVETPVEKIETKSTNSKKRPRTEEKIEVEEEKSTVNVKEEKIATPAKKLSNVNGKDTNLKRASNGHEEKNGMDQKEDKVNEEVESKPAASKKPKLDSPSKTPVTTNGTVNKEATAVNQKQLPPSEEELRKKVQEIIQGSNLDDITMKIVVEKVNSMYPNHDLSDKRTVIKNFVKEVLN